VQVGLAVLFNNLFFNRFVTQMFIFLYLSFPYSFVLIPEIGWSCCARCIPQVPSELY